MQAYRINNGVSTKGTGDAAVEKVCWRFLSSQYPGKVKSYNVFSKTVSFLNTVTRRNIFELLEQDLLNSLESFGTITIDNEFYSTNSCSLRFLEL